MVTVTSTTPAACEGVRSVAFVELVTTTLVAFTPPNVTVIPARKFLPMSVTFTSPAVVPVVGLSDTNTGAGCAARYVNARRTWLFGRQGW